MELSAMHVYKSAGACEIKLDAYPDPPVTGVLASVEPLSKTVGMAVQYKARVQFEARPAFQLYEGMSARLYFQVPDGTSSTSK